MGRLKKYFGNKDFYKMVIMVALPIMIQNGITNFVSLLDNIMVGRVGTEEMSGVAIVNQLLFVYMLSIFGAVSGVGIFTAQFHGKYDNEGIRQTFRLKIIAVITLFIIALVIFCTLNEQLISIYLNDGSQSGDLAKTLQFGKDYIWIMLIGLLPMAISFAFASTLREVEQTVVPMLAGFIAVIINCIGNYILIFGKLGAPAMGVKGAATATVVSRFIELGILVVYTYVKRDKYVFIKGAFRHFFRIDKTLAKNVLKKGMPLLINEMLWSAGISAIAWCFSKRGLAAVAGYNIASTVINVFNIAYMALGTSVGIIVGKLLGAGNTAEAIDTDRKLITFCVIVGLVIGGVLAIVAPYFPLIYNTTDEVKEIATGLMWVMSAFMFVQSFLHSCYFTLRSGGKTIVTFLYDSVFVCCISFPIVLLFAVFTNIPIVYLYLIDLSLDIFKSIVGYIFLKKKIWVNTIV